MGNKVNEEIKEFKELVNRIPDEITKETPTEVIEEMYRDFIVIFGAIGRIDNAISGDPELMKSLRGFYSLRILKFWREYKCNLNG